MSKCQHLSAWTATMASATDRQEERFTRRLPISRQTQTHSIPTFSAALRRPRETVRLTLAAVLLNVLTESACRGELGLSGFSASEQQLLGFLELRGLGG